MNKNLLRFKVFTASHLTVEFLQKTIANSFTFSNFENNLALLSIRIELNEEYLAKKTSTKKMKYPFVKALTTYRSNHLSKKNNEVLFIMLLAATVVFL